MIAKSKNIGLSKYYGRVNLLAIPNDLFVVPGFILSDDGIYVRLINGSSEK